MSDESAAPPGEPHSIVPGHEPAAGAAPAPVSAHVRRVLRGVGPERPHPTPGPVLVAVAAVLAGGAAAVLLGLALDTARATFVSAGLLLVAGGLFISFASHRLITASSVLVGLGVPVLVVGAFGESFADNAKAYLLVVTAAEAVLFLAVPRVHGRPFLLGLALLFAASLVGALVADTGSDDYYSGGYSSYEDEYSITPFDTAFGDDQSVANITLAVGAGYLVVALVLDRRRRAALATPFVGVGALTSITSVWTFDGLDDIDTTAIMVGAVGALLMVVGAMGNRRASQWVGAAQLAAGVILFATSLSSEGEAAWFVLFVGAAIGGVGVALMVRTERAAAERAALAASAASTASTAGTAGPPIAPPSDSPDESDGA